MRITDLWVVSALDKRLRETQAQCVEIEAGKALGVTISGQYQPDAVVNAMRPTMLAILYATITEIETQLRGLGVDLAPDADGERPTA